MLEKSDTSIPDVLKTLNAYNLDAGLLVPTSTGMNKSIMDATSSVREFFKDEGFHDYDIQLQGPEAKVTKTAHFVWADRLEKTTISMYRPMTKSGDPRLWFSLLGRYAEPDNLLALLVRDDAVYVVNCSMPDVMRSISNPNTPLGKIAAATSHAIDPAVAELLDMMRSVSARGFIRTLRAGDTGIGMTLETLLGISANTSKSPDYKGIEIKAKRLRNGRENRVTLFSQVPNWKLSPVGSAWNLLSNYGYQREGRLQLYHEMNALSPNSIGLALEVDPGRDWLKQTHCNRETSAITHVATWEMEKLRNRLQEKHPQTFWVRAKCKGKGVDEEFHYVEIEHTRRPKVRNFDALIEGGIISLDYTLSEKSGRVRDHGYLFKMQAADFPALFPPSEIHVLAA